MSHTLEMIHSEERAFELAVTRPSPKVPTDHEIWMGTTTSHRERRKSESSPLYDKTVRAKELDSLKQMGKSLGEGLSNIWEVYASMFRGVNEGFAKGSNVLKVKSLDEMTKGELWKMGINLGVIEKGTSYKGTTRARIVELLKELYANNS